MKHVALGLALFCLADSLLAGDDKGPKKPDRPFALAIMASARPPATSEAAAKDQKEVQDTIGDIKGYVQGKYKDWFTLVEDPAQAEIILEIDKRGLESGHGAVIEGHVRVFHLDSVHILGQGGLNPNSLDFRHWRQAASDMAGRLRTFCQATYATISTARKGGVRPLAVVSNDRGVDQMRAKKTDDAIASFEEASRLAPTYALPRFNRGLAHSSREEWPAAIQAFGDAIGIDAAYQRAYYWRAEARKQTKDLAGARTDLDEAIRLDPKHLDAWLDRGSLLAALGDYKAAIADFDQVIALDPRKKGLGLARQAFAWDRLGETERALSTYDGAMSAGYEDAALHYNRGRLLAKKGDEAKACSAFGAAAALDAKDPEIRFERGLCRAKKGQLDQAIEDFSESVRAKPEMAVAYYNRSLCYARQGKAKLASADRARAVRLDPALASAKK